MSRIETALAIATDAHFLQKDLGGNPYILHPLRVMIVADWRMRGESIRDKESVLCSAVLHDVLEDIKPQDKQMARENIEDLGDVVIKTVESMTRKEKESWNTYISRLRQNWAPRFLKIIDLEDNLDHSRLQAVTEPDLQRSKMYHKTLMYLRSIEGEKFPKFPNMKVGLSD